MRRGQSALEYLVTYGWAVLAIVIVAAILWYTGVFNPGKWGAQKQCGGFASLSCIDYTTNATAGTATVVLGNAAGSQITMSSPSCTPATVGVNAQTTCSWSGLSFSAGDQVNLPVSYTTAAGLTHTETGFVKATG